MAAIRLQSKSFVTWKKRAQSGGTASGAHKCGGEQVISSMNCAEAMAGCDVPVTALEAAAGALETTVEALSLLAAGMAMTALSRPRTAASLARARVESIAIGRNYLRRRRKGSGRSVHCSQKTQTVGLFMPSRRRVRVENETPLTVLQNAYASVDDP